MALKLKSQMGVGSGSLLKGLRDQLKFDKEALDEAVMCQPVLFDQVAEQYIILVSQRDLAKMNLERVEDDLALHVRKFFELKRGRKPTEGEVISSVRSQKDYRKAEDEYMRLVGKTAEWATLKESFTQRGHALRELCNLYSDEYWQKTSQKGGHTTERYAQRGRKGQRFNQRRR
jgi:hypothetical protein